MTNKKSTKRALIMSVLALLLCVSMLIGTTYAWFTDTVASSGNVIQAGTLEIALEKWENEKWVDASDAPIFDYELWEPGYTEVVNLRVINLGTLALKWQATITTESELSILADVINVYVRSDDQNDTIKDYIDGIGRFEFEALAEQGQFKKFTLREFVENLTLMTKGTLLPEQESYLGIVLQMDTAAGNEYQGLDLGGKFDLKIMATQYTYEEDSFDNQYDANAGETEPDEDDALTISTIAELRAAAAAGGTYKLVNDLAMDASEAVIVVSSEFVLKLNGFDLDFSANKSRPFEMADGSSLTVNASEEELKVGLYGLANIPAGYDATVILNGGKYSGKTDNGSLVKPRGTGVIVIELNNLDYNDATTNGYVMDTSSYNGSDLTVVVNGGTFTAYGGFYVHSCTIKGATVTSTAKNRGGIVARQAGVTIENCVINSGYSAVAVENRATVTVKDSTVNGGTYAFQVTSSGGTIEAYGCNYTGDRGTTGRVSAAALVYVDGVLVFEKYPA